ncbi:MAG: hypothetical protein EAY75_07195 [Bacteroidetes bacterium]|nr:MAG: hypothetical protein EAY75_07195 [Bacteroidota bacterium]
MMLGGVALFFMGNVISGGTGLAALGPALGAVYVGFGALYLYPSWKLMRFGSDMPAGLKREEQHLVTSAFGSLKTSFRFWGISAIVIIGLYVLFIIGISMFGMFS